MVIKTSRVSREMTDRATAFTPATDVFERLRQNSVAVLLVAEFLRDEPVLFYMRLLDFFDNDQRATCRSIQGMIDLIMRTLLVESNEWDEMNGALLQLHVERLGSMATPVNATGRRP